MAVQTHRTTRPGRSAKAKRMRAAKAASTHSSAHKTVDNAIPQKALLLAARLATPPAMSDEVPDEMPFPTAGQ